MRVLVTGGAGFIGSQVARALAREGHDVLVLDRVEPAEPDLPSVTGDIRDGDVVSGALRGVDAVIHQAAKVGMGVGADDLPDYVGDNDLATAVLLAAMAHAGITRLVLASSMVVYGEGAYACTTHGPVRPGPRGIADLVEGRFEPLCHECSEPLASGLVDEDAPTDPRSVYAATKVAQEHLAAAWARITGGRVVALRYHNVYGPGMPRDTPYSGVAAIFRSALERGEPPRVFEDGGQRRDFVHVDDVALANLASLAAVDAAEPGLRAYNISSGEPITVGEMAAAIAAAVGGPQPVTTGEFRAGDVRHIVASPARARRELGFVARVGPTDGLCDFATAPLPFSRAERERDAQAHGPSNV